jgi:hypothetical protein
MALIDCPDCGRRLSDKAEACPACARPMVGAVPRVASGEGGAGGSSTISASSSRTRGAPSARPKRPAHVFAVRAPVETAPPAVAVPAERRVVPTHHVVCTTCGEEEILAFEASRSKGYLCVSCEERALAIEASRRRVLQWWPLALVLVLLAVASAGTSWAISQDKAPHDPVTPGEH